MHKDFHGVILIYTFVDNKELDAVFLSKIKETYSETKRLNESTYSLGKIDHTMCENKIRAIYSECIKQYPSKGDDQVSVLFSARLINYGDGKDENKDTIVELHIVD